MAFAALVEHVLRVLLLFIPDILFNLTLELPLINLSHFTCVTTCRVKLIIAAATVKRAIWTLDQLVTKFSSNEWLTAQDA